MVKKDFGADIGPWTILKLEYIRKYLGAYSNILNRAGFGEYYFIDAFAGRGYCVAKQSGKTCHGSPLIALNTDPPFTKYYFIDSDDSKTRVLDQIIEDDYSDQNTKVITGDCNEVIDRVLNDIPAHVPFMALLDPQKGDLKWTTIEKIARKPKAEVLINFPLGMAMMRTMHLESKEKETDAIFGTNRWRPIYDERKRGLLKSWKARERFLDLYLNNLISVGFQYYAVKNIKNSKNASIYFLIFGSKNRLGLERMKDEFVKDEPERDTLFFYSELARKIYKVFHGHKNIDLDLILERLLSGKHNYRKQDFKEALKILLNESKIERVFERKRARSFTDTELINFN